MRSTFQTTTVAALAGAERIRLSAGAYASPVEEAGGDAVELRLDPAATSCLTCSASLYESASRSPSCVRVRRAGGGGRRRACEAAEVLAAAAEMEPRDAAGETTARLKPEQHTASISRARMSANSFLSFQMLAKELKTFRGRGSRSGSPRS